jgi:transcriptional regulator with XRE-family HTH domain
VEAWEFGRTLRRWRDRVTPDAVGVSAGTRRRAPGLRREEVAALAAISVDYLTRLEQGRAVAPSEQIIEALARALRLSDAERDHLFNLAGLAAPRPGRVSTRITPSVQRLLDRLANTPVCVHDAAWNLLVANAPYDALMGQTTAWRGIERNGVWRNLLGHGTRAVHTPAEKAAFEEGLVASLRLTAGRYPTDRTLHALITELRAGSPRFINLWENAELPDPREQSRHKIIDHPDVGRINLDCDVLTVAGDDLHITVYTAEPATQDADKLDLAIVLGTQRLVDRH